MRSDYFSADGSDYADVIFGLSRGDLSGLCCGAEREQKEQKTRGDRRARRFHRGWDLRAVECIIRLAERSKDSGYLGANTRTHLAYRESCAGIDLYKISQQENPSAQDCGSVHPSHTAAMARACRGLYFLFLDVGD